MTRMYIPALGDQLRLSAPWFFKLYEEGRNERMFVHLGYPADRPQQKFVHVALPIGTELAIDRIYIRRGQEDFDSITFSLLNVKACAGRWGGGKSRPRFWVKLIDVSSLEFDSILTHMHLADELP